MMMHLTKKRGQSTLEYAILIIVIIAALISIQTYIKRGVQGRLKSATDDIGDQFSPGNTNAIMAERTHSNTAQEFGVKGQGISSTKILGTETTNSVTKQAIVNEQKENWGN
jgi:uncharacterized protein (UPF0333 family)